MNKTLFVATLLFSIICENSFSQVTVSGIVKDNRGEVLSNAHVTINPNNKSAITDVQGGFSIEGLSSGNYTIFVPF